MGKRKCFYYWMKISRKKEKRKRVDLLKDKSGSCVAYKLDLGFKWLHLLSCIIALLDLIWSQIFFK